MIPLSLYSFYRVNEVQRFEYSRPIRKGEKNPDNEFAVKKKPTPNLMPRLTKLRMEEHVLKGSRSAGMNAFVCYVQRS